MICSKLPLYWIFIDLLVRVPFQWLKYTKKKSYRDEQRENREKVSNNEKIISYSFLSYTPQPAKKKTRDTEERRLGWEERKVYHDPAHSFIACENVAHSNADHGSFIVVQTSPSMYLITPKVRPKASARARQRAGIRLKSCTNCCCCID